MNFYVSDTHALLWYLINSPALGANARLAFDEADAGQALIYIPAIVIAELYYLNEKKGRPLDFRTKYARLAESKQFVLLPFHPSHTLDFDACSAVDGNARSDDRRRCAPDQRDATDSRCADSEQWSGITCSELPVVLIPIHQGERQCKVLIQLRYVSSVLRLKCLRRTTSLTWSRSFRSGISCIYSIPAYYDADVMSNQLGTSWCLAKRK